MWYTVAVLGMISSPFFLPGSLQECFVYATNRIKMSFYKISISKKNIDTRSSLEAFYARVTFLT